VAKTPEWKKVAIDGDTLEKRREQRKEQLEKFLWSLPKERQQGILGTVNQWTKEEGVKVVPSSQSLFDMEAKEKRLREDIEVEHTFEVPPIEKRTPQQRLESMTKRLLENPQQHEAILQEIAGEYWKAGAPVTVDALRAVAAHFLNRADQRRK
jgi:RNase P/RNase MRP subunit p29